MSCSPADNAAKTREIATDYFRTDRRKMAVNYAALTPETDPTVARHYSPDAPPEDIVLVQGDHDDLSWWDLIASTTDPTVARHLIGERPGATGSRP